MEVQQRCSACITQKCGYAIPLYLLILCYFYTNLVLPEYSCGNGDELIGSQFCVAIYTGSKTDNIKDWCSSYQDKELFIPPDNTDVYERLKTALLFNRGKFKFYESLLI